MSALLQFPNPKPQQRYEVVVPIEADDYAEALATAGAIALHLRQEISSVTVRKAGA